MEEANQNHLRHKIQILQRKRKSYERFRGTCLRSYYTLKKKETKRKRQKSLPTLQNKNC